jgi:hypothetical protein
MHTNHSYETSYTSYLNLKFSSNIYCYEVIDDGLNINFIHGKYCQLIWISCSACITLKKFINRSSL